MKSTVLKKLFAIAALVAVPASQAVAQGQDKQKHPPGYSVIDLGTPDSGVFANATGFGNGDSIGGYVVVPPAYNTLAILWKYGSVKNLGTYGGPNSGLLGGTSGFAETATPDPLGQDLCETGTFLTCRAFAAPFDVKKPLPTLGGYNAFAFGNNAGGQVVGGAQTRFLDPTCLVNGQPVPPFYMVQQVLPAVWQDGRVEALPIFPGDSHGRALANNDRGQVVGESGSCVNFFAHALLWDHGRVTALSGLGGSFTGAFWINNEGDVIGQSNLPGDTTAHAVLWHKQVIKDLGTLPGDNYSYANAINDEGQVVGGSCDASGNCRQVLWESDGTAYDINTLTGASPLYLLSLNAINDEGEIIGYAYYPDTGNAAPFLAKPRSNGAQGDAASTSSQLSPAAGSALAPNIPAQKGLRREFQLRTGQPGAH